MPIVQGGPLRTSVITCSSPFGQIRVTDLTTVFIFIIQVKMEQMLNSVEDPERIERAKKRGKAWQCLRCHYRDQKRWVDIKCRVEDHVMKMHLALEKVPFYCKLCLFRCQRKDQLVTHVTKYKRHVDMAAKSNIIDHSPCLVQNAKPHVMGPLDYKPLTAEESLQHFLGIRQAQPSTSNAPESESMDEISSESPIPVTEGTAEAPVLNTEAWGQIAAQTLPTDVNSLSPTIGLPTDGFCLNDQLMSGQLTQLLNSVINNQQQLLTNYSNSLVTSELLSQPVLRMMQSIPASAKDLVCQESVKESTFGQEVVGQDAATISNDVVDQIVNSTQGMASQYASSAADEVVNLPITPKDQEDVNLTITKPSQGMTDKPDSQPNNAEEGQPLDLSVTDLSTKSSSYNGQDKEGAHAETKAEERTDIRKVVTSRELQPATTEEYEPQYVPTPVEQLRKIKDKKVQDPEFSVEATNNGDDEHVLNDILPNEDMTIASPVKRVREKEDYQTAPKRRKQDHSSVKLPVDVHALSEGTLVTVVDIFRLVMEKNAVAVRKMEEKLTESVVTMSKLVDVISRLKNSVDEHEKEEQRREDRRRDFENRREEERRRDINRWREEERRRDEWRREVERKDREDRRKREDKTVDNERSDKRKENQDSEKTVLGSNNSKQVERRGRRW